MNLKLTKLLDRRRIRGQNAEDCRSTLGTAEDCRSTFGNGRGLPFYFWERQRTAVLLWERQRTAVLLFSYLFGDPAGGAHDAGVVA